MVGPNGNCPIVIRDDDINYFTSPHMLKNLYSLAWNKGFKISLSVIPNQNTFSDSRNARALLIPPEYRRPMGSYSILDNNALINYLQKKALNSDVCIMLHGYNHDYPRERAEFNTSNLQLLYNKFKNGVKIVNTISDKDVLVFIPPSEDISKIACILARKMGLFVLNRSTFIDTLKQMPFGTTLFGLLLPFYSNQRNAESFNPYLFKPATINFKTPSVLVSNPLVSNLHWTIPLWTLLNLKTFEATYNMVRILFKRSYSTRSGFMIMHHYHAYFYDWKPELSEHKLLTLFNQVLQFMDAHKNLWKTTIDDYVARADVINRTQISTKKNYITFISPKDLNNFTFCLYNHTSYLKRTFSRENGQIITIPELKQAIPYELNTKNY